MAIQNARMQQKRGEEFNFDPDKMLPGEWAVSLDTKYVRMCFSPGVCVRMATYEAFEEDMKQIQTILTEARTIQEAVTRINTEVSTNAEAVAEYTEQAKAYRDEAEQFRNEAFSATPDGYEKLVTNVTENTVKIDTIIEKAELNIKNTASGENIHLTDSANSKVVEFGLYGKATQDGEPTPDNPIDIEVAGADGSVGVASCGKNLVGSELDVYYRVPRIKGGSYITISTADGSNFTPTKMTIYDVNKVEINIFALASNNVNTRTVQVAKLGSTDVCYITLSGGTPQEVMVTVGQLIEPYEPYTETTSTIPTPNGLAGIPVDSGGNYTDKNGQQWIADEIVKYADGSGKRVQRIGKAVFDGSSDEEWYLEQGTVNRFKIRVLGSKSEKVRNPVLCSHGIFRQTNEDGTAFIFTEIFYYYNSNILSSDALKEWFASNNMTVYYELAEPIITDLTAEEIAEIEKLHTFYPITNISNDADCGMSITYLADSKNYIDGQLAIQKDQQEEALVTMLLLMPEEVQASMIENDTNNLLNESEV